MRIRCNSCGKSVSSEVPDDTVLRAYAECPECIEKRPDYEDEIARLKVERGALKEAYTIAIKDTDRLQAALAEKERKYKSLLEEFDARRFEGGREVAKLLTENTALKKQLAEKSRECERLKADGPRSFVRIEMYRQLEAENTALKER
jgi:chromosome segregation ATPase